MRRFLRIIGPANILRLRHVAFILEDAVPSLNRGEDAEQRRFIYDENLFSIMRRLSGPCARLQTLYVNFHGRRHIVAARPADSRFLEAFTRIRADDVRFERWHSMNGYWACLGKPHQDDKVTELLLAMCQRTKKLYSCGPHISPAEAIIPEAIRNSPWADYY